MKLFQIEEPDGSPVDPEAPGAAIGVDFTGPHAEVAVSVGGNAVMLQDREGFERELPVPPADAPLATWQELFEGVRLRAERALAQPVTHAVAVVRSAEPVLGAKLVIASEAASLSLLRTLARADIDATEAPALTAAILAEDLAPRPAAD